MAAAIDMDELVFMTNGPNWLTATSEHWRLARLLAAKMGVALLEDGVRLVALAGLFFTAESRDDLLRQIPAVRKPPFVRLQVSFLQHVALELMRVAEA